MQWVGLKWIAWHRCCLTFLHCVFSQFQCLLKLLASEDASVVTLVAFVWLFSTAVPWVEVNVSESDRSSAVAAALAQVLLADVARTSWSKGGLTTHQTDPTPPTSSSLPPPGGQHPLHLRWRPKKHIQRGSWKIAFVRSQESGQEQDCFYKSKFSNEDNKMNLKSQENCFCQEDKT